MVSLSFGFGTVITLIGIPVLVGALYAWRWLAELERRLIGALTGVRIQSPYRPAPPGGLLRRLQARLGDPATWKDLLFLMFQLGLGIISFTVAATVLGAIAATLFAPAWYWAVPDGLQIGIFTVDTLGEAIALVPLGVVLTLVGIPALGALGRLYGMLAALLLGSGSDPELTAQVSDLEDARSRIIAAGDAERRRIERDLHDGAQQRLVALALTLRMAEGRAQSGDPEAVELIKNAGDEAGLALSELRDLARGIHPAILTNRGLAAALEDLASRASVPVEVAEAPRQRHPDQVEAAAYFVVSECLANVDKHAGATAATVAVREEDGCLTVSVVDDGAGGAALDGSGLQGLRDRVGALAGTLEVDSPIGEGTRVTAAIPLDVPVGELEATVPPAVPAVLDDARADLRQARRRSGLWIRLGRARRPGCDRRGRLGTDRCAQRLAGLAAAGSRPARGPRRLVGAGRSSPARVRSVADGRPDGRDPRRPAPPLAAPRRRLARDHQPVPDRHLAGRGRQLLLAGLAHPGQRAWRGHQGAALAGASARAASGRGPAGPGPLTTPRRRAQWPQPSATSCRTVSSPVSPVRIRTA